MRGSVNADGGSVNAGTKVQTWTGRVRKSSRAMGTRRRRLSAPWLQFHGVDRADVYIIIHVRACCCGECALNPLPSQSISRRRPSLAPAQRHARPEHFRPPPQRRHTPTQRRCIPRRPHNPFSAEDFRSPLHSDTPFPSTSDRPCSADARPPTARRIPRRPHNPFPAEGLRPPPHSDTPSLSTSAPPRSADARPQAARCIPHRPHNTFPAEGLRPPTHSDTPVPNTSAPPRSPDARPQAARCTPADRTPHSPQRHAASPFRSASGTKKTAPHSECAMPNVSVDRRAVGHLGW